MECAALILSEFALFLSVLFCDALPRVPRSVKLFVRTSCTVNTTLGLLKVFRGVSLASCASVFHAFRLLSRAVLSCFSYSNSQIHALFILTAIWTWMTGRFIHPTFIRPQSFCIGSSFLACTNTCVKLGCRILLRNSDFHWPEFQHSYLALISIRTHFYNANSF